MLLLAILALVAPPDAPPVSVVPPRQLAGYVLVESKKTISPAGERASAERGSVTVLDGAARWDLETGTFPRSTANTIILGDRGGWLLDRKASVAARARLEDFRDLFVPPAQGDSGPFQSSLTDVEVSPAELTKGPPFEGRPTSRLRVKASWTLAASMPGRVNRVRCSLTATVLVLGDPPEGIRSGLDDPARLFDVPAPVLEALAPELARLPGFPVQIVVEIEAQLGVDYPGAAAPPSERVTPLRTHTETTRTVSELKARPANVTDSARFALSEQTRVIGIERLVEPRESLR